MIVTPKSPEYSEARLNWDPWTSQFPSYIVYPQTEEDIKTAILFCQKNNIPFRIRGNVSHSLGYDFSSVNGGLVCNVRNFTKVEYLSDTKIRVGAGNKVGDLIFQLAKDGYMFPYGDVYTVGIAGIIQGGGIGLQNKQMGLVSDNLVSCKLTLADTSVVEVNNSNYSDLHWALQGGGGGNWGVATEMTLNFQKAPSIITYITMKWTDLDLNNVKQIIIEWMNTNLYENVNIARNLEINKQTENDLYKANIDCLIYNNDESLFIFKPIGKYVKTVSLLTYYEMVQQVLGPSQTEIHTDVNQKFLGYFSNNILPEETVDLIVKYFQENDSDLFFLEFGGAFRKDPRETAFPWRSAKIYFELSKLWPVYENQQIIYRTRGRHFCGGTPEEKIPKKVSFESYRQTAKILGDQYKMGYVNVPNNTYTNPSQYERFYYGKNRRRLRRIKQKYDPQNFFNFSQSVR